MVILPVMLFILVYRFLQGKRVIADLEAETEAAGHALPSKQMKIQVGYTPLQNHNTSDTPFEAHPHL
jgi:hypothetical protein